MKIEYIPATKISAARTLIGDYVISHWPHGYVVTYRPSGQHVPVGVFPTLTEATEACRLTPAPAKHQGK